MEHKVWLKFIQFCTLKKATACMVDERCGSAGHAQVRTSLFFGDAVLPCGRDVNALCGTTVGANLKSHRRHYVKKLSVGNLSYTTHEEDLREAFSP